MSVEQNKAVLRRWYEEGVNGDRYRELAEECMDPGMVIHNPSHDVVGRDQVLDVVSGARTALADLRIFIEDMVGEGDKVACRATITAKHVGEVMGIAPSGKPVEYWVFAIIRFVDGRLAESHEFGNALEVLSQAANAGEPA